MIRANLQDLLDTEGSQNGERANNVVTFGLLCMLCTVVEKLRQSGQAPSRMEYARLAAAVEEEIRAGKMIEGRFCILNARGVGAVTPTQPGIVVSYVDYGGDSKVRSMGFTMVDLSNRSTDAIRTFISHKDIKSQSIPPGVMLRAQQLTASRAKSQTA